MHEFLSEDLALACHSAGLLQDPKGAPTAAFMEAVEAAGPVLAGRDHSDPALVAEVRLATGPLLEPLDDAAVAMLLPTLQLVYARQKLPSAG